MFSSSLENLAQHILRAFFPQKTSIRQVDGRPRILEFNEGEGRRSSCLGMVGGVDTTHRKTSLRGPRDGAREKIQRWQQ